MRFFSKKHILLSLVIFLSAGVFAVEAYDPVVIELHYQNGIKFYKRGLYERAIQEFEKTLSLDPGHAEAKEYLAKVKEEKGKLTRVDSKKSTRVELDSLYKEGKKRYAKHDYNGALEIFEDILKIKPIDDYASYYKERCEILISHQLEREKKLEDKKRRVEQARENKIKAQEAVKAKKAEKAQMLAKRRSINQERRGRMEEKMATAKDAAVEREIAGLKGAQELAPVIEEPVLQEAPEPAPVKSKKEILREQKRLEKEAKAAEKKAKIQEKRDAARIAREEKIEAKKAEREEKLALKRQEKENVKKTQATPSALENKALFLKGVEEYGRKEYDTAIESFKELIQIESSGRKLYTNSAKRLMEKAKKKMEKTEIKEKDEVKAAD